MWRADGGGEPVIKSLPKTTLLTVLDIKLYVVRAGGARESPTARSALRLVLAQCRCPRDVGRRVLFR